MPYHYLKFVFTNYPSSPVVAQRYARNVHRPLANLLTPLRLAYYAYLLLLAIRLGFNFLFGKVYSRYDLPMYIFRRVVRNPMICLVLIPFALLAFVFDLTLVVRPHRKVAPMLTDLLKSDASFKQLISSIRSNSGSNNFTNLVPSASRPVSLNAYSSLLIEWTRDWLELAKSNLDYLLSDLGIQYSGHQRHHTRRRLASPPPLAYFRSFSSTTRCRLALLDRLVELIIAISLPIESTFLVISIVHFAWRANAQFGQQWVIFENDSTLEVGISSSSSAALKRLLGQLQMIVEAVAVIPLLQYIHKQGMIFYKLVSVFTLAWCLHAREVLQLGVRRMKAAEQSSHYRYGFSFNRRGVYVSQQRFSAAIHSIWVNNFIWEHCALLVNLVHLNEHLISQLIFAFFTPMLIASIFILCLLYFQSGNLVIKLYLLLLYLGIFFTFVILVFLSVIVKVLYDRRGARQLFRAQMLCRGGNVDENGKNGNAFLRIKLKLMLYYEVLRTEKKVAFTFGSHAKIESTWLWELFILYSSLIMYSFKIFIKRSTELRYLNAKLNDF